MKKCTICKTEPRMGNYKRCRNCYNEKRREEYKDNPTKKKNAVKKYYSRNRQKCLAKRIEYQQQNKPAVRNRQLIRKFSITLEEYNRKLRDQDGKCAICGTQNGSNGRSLAVDHDHQTGRIRKLLCDRCNRGLGFFDHNPKLLEFAKDYLCA
jgi:hypothetical protein